MIRVWREQIHVLSTKVISKQLRWEYGNWIYNNTSECMQKAIGFEVGVEKTTTNSAGINVNLSQALSIGLQKTISWAETVTKVDTITISIKPHKKGTIRYQTGTCEVEIIVREKFMSRQTNGHCGFISTDTFYKDHREVKKVKVHIGDAVGVEEQINQQDKKIHFLNFKLLMNQTAQNITQSNSKKAYENMRKFLEKKKSRQSNSANTAALISKQFGTRLSAHSISQVGLSSNNGSNEQWQWVWIGPNKLNWKSKIYGTYLRAWPDGHLDLTTNHDAWEVWTKIDCGSHIFWQSHFGTFLCGNSDRTICLTGNKLAHEYWTH